MKKNTPFPFVFFLLLLTQFCFSQVDVVYNDLVFSDDFNTNGAVNTNKWFHQTQLPSGGSWFNGELQHYTNRTVNSFVDDGLLNIVAKKENFTDQDETKSYTSARLNSKFAFKYGRVDVRAKLPVATGTWPAIWMLGKNVNEDGAYFDASYGTVNWPACGEIDIMEHGIFPSQSINYIQSTLHTPSSSGNSGNSGGTISSNLQNDYHIYSMNWSPNEISFLLDNVVYYTYNPSVKNASTWPFDKEQFLLLNIAMGGISGNIPSNFTQAVMQIDYVRVYQNVTVDNQNPTNFTAAVGTVTGSTVQLLLNADDNSGNMVYTINYGAASMTVSSLSGIQKSVVIPGLNPNTTYTFSVSANDLAGNAYLNNPIVLTATTTGELGCSGTDNTAQQENFEIGYTYNFETTGTDVKITFELLDTNPVGVVAYLWKQNPFGEQQMANVSGNIFTKTITNQTIGATINYAVKFAFAGGLAVTKYFPYVVGSDCALGIQNPTDVNQFTFQNPTNDVVQIHSTKTIDSIEIYNMLGALVATAKNTNVIAIKNLSKGTYLLTVYSGTQKSVKKLVVN